MSFRFESDNGDSTLTLLSENITLIQIEATIIALCVRIKFISRWSIKGVKPELDSVG